MVDGNVAVFGGEIDVVRENVVAGVDIGKREFEDDSECSSYAVWIPLGCITEVANVSIEEASDADLAASDVV